ncbi:MAG: hypothetical protein JW864_00545 [Spirochaetes bacterium]|nr:hypothetical protein [Spirochaetota bacterium]
MCVDYLTIILYPLVSRIIPSPYLRMAGAI